MKIGVAKETEAGELRVALVPDIVARLLKQGIEVTVEAGAGVAAHHSDSDYESAGATIADTAAVWASEMVVKVS
ncbi:MAG: NAD(P)(+) transhydrogenase (Re/Si-specific) subunit alpha, partial [Cyanobacteria bacterium J06641_5]